MLKFRGVFENRKSQMKIQQMSFMLVAVLIFFVLIGLAVLAVNMSGLEDRASELAQQNARLLVSGLADSPEFSCGNSFGSSVTSCVDMDKAMALKGNSEAYTGFWGVEKIEVRNIHPSGSSEECTQSNYPDCGRITVVSGSEESNFTSIDTFVSVCRKNFDSSENFGYDDCNMGKLLVSYENV